MTSKEYLSQVYKLEQIIEKKQMRVKEYEQLASSISGCNFDKISVDGTKTFDAPFVKWIEKALDIQEEINNLKMKLETCRNEILEVIESLDNEEHKTLLVLRYLKYLSWAGIAEELGISISTAKRWHKTALLLVKFGPQ